jgi:two-component system phosphate regulon sensor histidine kinase PhoR
MSWFLGFLVIAITAAWSFTHWRAGRHWRHVEDLLSALAEGRKPGSFVFLNGGRFSKLANPLENVSREMDRLRAEISREEFNLHAILSSMEEGVMVVDAHHSLQLVNPSFLKLFDLKGDPRGQTILRTLRETAFEEMVTEALATNSPQTRDVLVSGLKPPRSFEVYAAPMMDQESGHGAVMIFRDISRLKRLEEVRREFVANVSHELRTPLSIFHGYLENLMDSPEMPREEQAEIFAVLDKHSQRLHALLEDLLILARLESRHDQLDCEEIALEAFVPAVCEDWKAKMAKKKIALSIELPPNLPPLTADPMRLEQVMNNLLENALKYTEANGDIRVRAAERAGGIELRVEDTGIGIPPADLPHIFERFYRADKARSRERGGTGLGLSIVKHIVQLHGGSVSAQSKYGSGTAIILTWPPAAAAAAAAA